MATNVRLSGAQTAARSESDIRFNVANLNQIIGSCNDLQSSTMEIFSSASGGSGSWTNTQLPAYTGDIFQSDPAVDWTSDGTAWALAIGVVSNPPLVANVRCFKLASGGSWTWDSNLSPTNTSTDKASLWVDHSSTSPYHDNMYAIWHDGGEALVASRPGPGGTWNTPVQVNGSESSGSADGGDVKTNANGDVFAFWPSSGNQKIFVAKSIDGGTSFGTPVQIGTTNGSFWYPIPAQASRNVLIYVTAGAYRTATDDYVYACWHDLAGGSSCNSNSDAPGSDATSTCTNRIWFTRSIDGGVHWETPWKINDQNALNDQFFPRMVCDQTSGVLMVVYYDTIGNSDRVHTDIWMQTSNDNGVSWSAATKVTTAESNESTASANGNQYGDYIGITGSAGSFFACWTDSRNNIEEIWGAPLTTTSIQLALQKSTYGKDEVALGPSFAPAYWLEVTGFTNAELGLVNTGDLSNNPSPTPVIGVTIDASLNPSLTAAQISSISSQLSTIAWDTFGPKPIVPTDPTLQSDTQTFLYPYTVTFPGTSIFNALAADQSAILTISASLTVGQITRTASANIELTSGEDPYFEDLNPSAPAEYPSWLSFDLRFFKVAVPNTPGGTASRFNATMTTDPADATGFIATAIANLTAGGGTVGSDGFDKLSEDEESTTIEFLPQDSSGNLVFNFAVARVRLKGNTPGAKAQKVRVFFRLFQAQSTVSNFDTSTTYRYQSDGILNGVTVPLLGIQDNEYVTIPCFATPRVNLKAPADMTTQPEDTPNAYTIDVKPGVEVDSFFGCWLDVNQPQQQFLVLTPPAKVDGPFSGTLYSLSQVIAKAPHQCVVAEIRFDDTPIPAGATTADSDKLAQRNIAWVDGPNPGLAESRRMPHPFEIRATPATLSTPDELLVFWGNTPEGSTASFYLPAVSAAEIEGLASAMYQTHLLTALDAHTIQCPVGGATLIPIPNGTTRNAGLLTIALPATVTRGDQYSVNIIQLTQGQATLRPQPPPPPQPQIAIAEQQNATAEKTFTWRRVLGAFRVTIPVKTKSELLGREERLLGWLLWILETLPVSNRWYPVLQRYIRQIKGRVSGFGGNPGSIGPSPTGGLPLPHHGPGSGLPHLGGIGYTGKVTGVVYDRFGDFEGFTLLTETGEIRGFRGREPRVEELVRVAWAERTVITVYVDPHQRDWPTTIVLDRLH
jgi:hypothetical protein